MITVVTATGLETAAARKLLPAHVRVMRAGISLRNMRERLDGIAVSCGVAGGLRVDLPTGTVLVPRSFLRPDGTIVHCDADLVESFLAAAHSLGHEAVDAPLLTSATFVHGPARAIWADRGYAGVDMETGLLDAERLACVRVVLDTPGREISPAWGTPGRAAIDPRAWRDLPFLAREGPRCAQIAASVIACALRSTPVR